MVTYVLDHQHQDRELDTQLFLPIRGAHNEIISYILSCGVGKWVGGLEEEEEEED